MSSYFISPNIIKSTFMKSLVAFCKKKNEIAKIVLFREQNKLTYKTLQYFVILYIIDYV